MQITFDDGVKLSDFKMVVLKGYESPLMPTIINKTKQIPGRVGAWDFGSELGALSFKYPIAQLSQNPLERTEMLKKFISFLTDKKGQPRLVKVSINYEPDLYILCKVEINPTARFYLAGADFEIQFVANNPFKMASSDQFDPKEPVLYDQVKAEDYYPNTQQFDWIYTPHHYCGIYNYSSLETDLKITITGSFTNASITSMNSSLELTIPDLANGTMIIDSENYNIQINGEDTLLGNANFFKLEPDSNQFLFKADTANATVKFDWLHKFL